MKTIFQMGIQRPDFFGPLAFRRPYLGQDNPGMTCEDPSNPETCFPTSPGPAGAALIQPQVTEPAGAAQTVQPVQGEPPSPSSSTNPFSDISRAAAIILGPSTVKRPVTPTPAMPAPIVPASSTTGVLVGVGLLAAIGAGILFLG